MVTIKKRDVLFVDDEEGFREIAKEALESEGFAVRTAINGKEALKEINTCMPGVVFMDVNMPEMSGIELLKAIRSEKYTKDIPIVMVTSAQDKETVMKTVELKANGFIVKPFQLPQLIEFATQMLKGQSPLSMDVQSVKELLLEAKNRDDKWLLEANVKNQASDCDAYAVQMHNLNFRIIVPKGMKPSSMAAFSKSSIQSQARVFCQNSQFWIRVWP